MNNLNNNLPRLINKYLQNKLTPEEYGELWALLNKNETDDELNDELVLLWQETKASQMVIPENEWNKKMQLLKDKTERNEVFDDLRFIEETSKRKYWWAAAAVFFIAITGLVFFNTHKNVTPKNEVAVSKTPATKDENDRQPGSNKAQLTLADGSIINLDSSSNGILAEQGTAKIIKKSNGQLVYDASGEPTNDMMYNTLATPRGGQYNIALPDGSKVWLNSSSSIKYPATFSGKERVVQITGEAYFEVAKNVEKPFKVKINQMEVEVLGTRFNINGYDDESFKRTTLLEGKVKIKVGSIEKQLIPGQQAQLEKNGNISINKIVNLEEVVAWKDGNFQFENGDIQSVMRQLARWYDMDVTYLGTVSKHFGGTISRNVNLSQVLNMLQQTGEVKFRLDGKKIIVSP